MRAFELAIRIKGDAALGAQLYRELRRLILEGRLRHGEKLPSSRDLALTLRLSRKTVLEAIARLTAEGYLATRHGSGTFVAIEPNDLAAPKSPVVRSRRLSPWAEALPAIPTIASALDAPIDFRPGLPDLKSFPAEAWRRASARKLQDARRQIGFYGDPAGDSILREELAQHLALSRGLKATARDVIITNGAQQAFDLLARLLVCPGLCVAVEDPCYPGAVVALKAAGARLVPVPVDEEGLIVSRLPDDAAIVYVTPSHQFPLGYTMSLTRRLALLDWARARNALIIEDDYDSEYRYSERPLEALQGLDGSSSVAYVGTFSKTLLPGFRLGYLVAPPDLRGPLLAAKWISDRHVPSLAQMALAEFMSDGSFASYLRHMRRIYAERHAILSEGLARIAPRALRVIPSHAGLHLTALLADALDETDLAARAREVGVGLYPLSGFGIAVRPPGFLFGFGNLPVALIRDGLGRLAALLAESGEVRAAGHGAMKATS
ncbi:GntR family transcriptional regulator [Aliidongia dinghuensis]|uniref:GntR family transcriptional regulator n=1 Tax=Aliidongia dinghuensis TaxID=1867774 RepID=A0A8J2YVA2_9PROT|nr:PLP-dependent aminotransferase family protein [Aliidongia dinghuensis]GGF19776.1 GntR family transcriptional regulator [Aliidongia dinghuensis]